MSCTTANLLRLEWYGCSVSLDASSSEADKELAMHLRELKIYKDAKEKLINHLANCEECKKEWRS